MKAAAARQLGLVAGLLGFAANSRDANKRLSSAALFILIQGRASQRQNRLQQIVMRFTDFELGRVNADRNPARSTVEIVSRQRPLPPFIKFTVFVERQGVSGNHLPLPQRIQNRVRRHGVIAHQNLPVRFS